MEEKMATLVFSKRELVGAGLFIVGCSMIAKGVSGLIELGVEGIFNKLYRRKNKKEVYLGELDGKKYYCTVKEA